ncbi:MAG: TetR family transcriptional regulator [Anaeromyxobacteraceae bacterium]
MPRRKPPRPGTPRRPRQVPEDTRARILAAAERLFAERGVDAVSIRSVLKEAGVNVALAHYHFGSREGLIEELLRTRVTAHEGAMIRAIDEVDARGKEASLEELLRAYFAPMARAVTENRSLGKLLAQLQVSPNPEIRAMGREAVRATLHRLGDSLVGRVPCGLQPQQFLVRLYMCVFMPAVFAAQWEALQGSARKRFPDRMPTTELLIEELVAFCAAGLRAEAGGGAER